jgi:hypothetical protein
MKALIRGVFFGFLILPILGGGTQAQTDGEQIEALKREIEEIQRRNQEQIDELRKKIEALEVEREAEKKRTEDLVTRQEAEEKEDWMNKIEAGYKDGFFLKSKDGNFSLRMRERVQFQFSVNDTTDELTATDFNIRRLRLYWDGNAFKPWLLYYIQASADSGDFELLDAYFDAAYNTMLAPRVGQYKVPFNREELNSSATLQLVERSIVNEEFTFGRDRGTGTYGVIGNYVVYGAGIFNGDGTNGTSVDSNLLYAGRVQFTPCCGELKYKQGSFPTGGDYNMEPNFGPKDKALIAISAAIGGIPGLNIDQKTPDNSDLEERFEDIFGPDALNSKANVIEFTADFNFRYYIFSMEGEYVLRNIDPVESGFESPTDQGFRIQSGIFLIPALIEVAGRFAFIDFDKDVAGPDLSYEITPGLNFYMSHNHKWKLQLSYSFIKNTFTDADDVDQNIFRAQVQVYF